MDIGAKLAEHAKNIGDKPAVIFNDRPTTYKELNERAVRLGNAMGALGLTPGDKVAAILRNSAEYMEIIHGLAKAGMVHVPVNWRFASEEMKYVIDNSGASAVVVGEEFADKLTDARADLPNVDPGRYVLIGKDAPFDVLDYEKIIAEASADEIGIENAKPGLHCSAPCSD